MMIIGSQTRGRLAFAFLLTVLASAAPAFGARASEGPIRYARVVSSDARILNLADENGVEIAKVESGTLVAIHRELAGWLEVEVPQGFVVWVFGRYLQPTDDAEIHEVVRNAVNIRPRPKSDVSSFPLPQRLHVGDRVRVIDTLDPELPLAETWARIWSPPGVHAWLRADNTEALPASEDGGALWAAADRPRQRPAAMPRATTTAALAGVATAATEAGMRTELTALTEAMDSESKREQPDYTAVRTGLAGLAATSSGQLAIEVRAALGRLGGLEEIALLRTELASERERRIREARTRQSEAREAGRAKDPLGEVFTARGVLVRSLQVEGTPRYHVRFGKRVVCEVICAAGRYDLDLFSGYEVGVFGVELGVDGAPAGDTAVIDVRRLEIIARR